ncbi:hypothetical protein [Desulfovibrio inopinatus]|uniref:hypothetical protein n=1 Tax=Desulfovibrio inopinatus TaxID=102109 RepID=UPI00040E2F8F|nr:hypothetical protein [Desulfovibrio inopinatus]
MRSLFILVALSLVFSVSSPAMAKSHFIGTWYAQGRSYEIRYDQNRCPDQTFAVTDNRGRQTCATLVGNKEILIPEWNDLRGALSDHGRVIKWSNGVSWERESKPKPPMPGPDSGDHCKQAYENCSQICTTQFPEPSLNMQCMTNCNTGFAMCQQQRRQGAGPPPLPGANGPGNPPAPMTN